MNIYQTPITKLNLDSENEIYIKRDDIIPIALGGNKVRKAKYFLEDALKQGADCLVTYGAKQSNHCRVISAIAAMNGLKCVLILAEDDHKVEFNGNYLAFTLFNADTVVCSVDNVKECIESTISNLKKEGFNPYFIQGGGHGNLGTKAYVDTYLEFKQQCDNVNINFDYIFFASGTGTTHAGLEIGKRLNNGNESIVGISIARTEQKGKKIILESIEDYKKEYNLTFEISINDINFIDEYRLDGYGNINNYIIDTIKHVAKTNGILLDPIYTGKAFWGMNEYIKANKIKGKKILFIHTGGTPLVFNYAELFR